MITVKHKSCLFSYWLTHDNYPNKMIDIRHRLYIYMFILLAFRLDNVLSSDGSRKEDDKPCPDKPNIIVIVADDMVSVIFRMIGYGQLDVI